jgi:hypothetical protein
VEHARRKEMKTFNLKKCLEEITDATSTIYSTLIFKRRCIEIIKSNIQENPATSECRDMSEWEKKIGEQLK